MANEQNLKPFTSDQSREEAVKNGRKGGEASGKARRDKRTYRKLAEIMLGSMITDENKLAELESYGLTEDKSIKALTLLGMIKACESGSHQAFDRLLEIIGEKETPLNSGSINDDLLSLAELINKPQPNRKIEDFENDE